MDILGSVGLKLNATVSFLGPGRVWLFCILALIVRPTFGQNDQATGSSIKVMTYNIWNGFDWGKDLDRKDRLINWVKSKDPDVLALQELCGYTEAQLSQDAAQWGHPFAVLLKTEGYPLGFTSKEPINLVEKMVEPLWHGMLHCQTYGLDFFVVHLSPSDLATRRDEARIITEKIRAVKKEGRQYMVLGDFNALSPFDANHLAGNQALLQRYLESDRKKEKYQNLEHGQLDYSVISAFLSVPTIDVCQKFLDRTPNFTSPTPILIGSYYTSQQEIDEFHKRIDFILTSPELANSCQSAVIYNGPDTGYLSDHYPVMAELKWPVGGK